MTVPKVIASDLDGTLLGQDGELSARTLNALLSARDRGIAVVAVTARPPRVFDEWMRLAEALDAAICSNGAIAYSPAEREIAATRTLSSVVAAQTAKALQAVLPTARFAVETGFEVVAEAEYVRVDSVGDRRIRCDSFAEVLTRAGQIAKLLVHDPAAEADVMLAAARGLAMSDVEVSHAGGAGLLEISASGVSKAAGLAEWCAGHGVGAEGVVAFGDAPNDVPMLRWAHRSFAVANGHPEALAAATGRCGPNTADGVAATLEAMMDDRPGRRT